MKQEFLESVDKKLKLTTKEAAINKAITRMNQLGLPKNIIEDFTVNGKPKFCIENGICIPLDKKQCRTVTLLEAVGYIVYAVTCSEKESMYLVSSQFKTHWLQEDQNMAANFCMVYYKNEFKILPAELICNSIFGAGADVTKQIETPLETSFIKENDKVGAEDINYLKELIYDDYSNYCNTIYNPSPNRALEKLFSKAAAYDEVDTYTGDCYDDINVHMLTYNLDDYVALTRTLYLLSHGTIKDIILKSGLTNVEFCDKLGIQYYMPDIWDSGKEECSKEYRFLIGRYLGMIREPSFIRDAYSFSAQCFLTSVINNVNF